MSLSLNLSWFQPPSLHWTDKMRNLLHVSLRLVSFRAFSLELYTGCKKWKVMSMLKGKRHILLTNIYKMLYSMFFYGFFVCFFFTVWSGDHVSFATKTWTHIAQFGVIIKYFSQWMWHRLILHIIIIVHMVIC